MTTTIPGIARVLRELADDIDPATEGIIRDLGAEWREDTAQDLRAWADDLDQLAAERA